MADLSITAANVVAGSGVKTRQGTAGVAVTAGQTVYKDPTDQKYKLADCDSATAAVRRTTGIALHASANNQPLLVHYDGPLTIGATLAPGVAYYLSPNPGGICPVADLSAGDYPTIIGIAKSASVLDVKLHESGVAL